MNTRQFIEVAALVSALNDQVRQRRGLPPDDAVQRGWSCLRGLQRDWMSTLRRVPAPPPAAYPEAPTASSTSPSRRPSPDSPRPAFPMEDWSMVESPHATSTFIGKSLSTDTVRPSETPRFAKGDRSLEADRLNTVAEILITETGVRVWAGLLLAWGDQHPNSKLAPIVRNALLCQAQVRQLALQQIVNGAQGDLESSSTLDRLRRIGERWTDMLLAPASESRAVAECLFDLPRAQEFLSDLRESPRHRSVGTAWDLVFTSLRAVFPSFPYATPLRMRLVEGIVQSLLSLLPQDSFNDAGSPASPWLRLARQPSNS